MSRLAGIILHSRGAVWNLLYLCSHLVLTFSKNFIYIRDPTLLDWGTHISSATLCTPPSFTSHHVNTFVNLEWGRGGRILVRCPAVQPPVLPTDPYRAAGCTHSSSHEAAALRRANLCPKSLLQFISVILAVNARGRVQFLSCLNRVGERYVGNTSKSSFPSDCFVLETLCRISGELFVLGIKRKKKKLFHILPQYFPLLSRGWVNCCSLFPCSIPYGLGCSPGPVATS